MTYDEYEKIKNLQDLLEKGALTQEEFDAEKAKVLDREHQPTSSSEVSKVQLNSKPLFGLDENLYLLIMHLSQFFSAFIVPLVMWLVGKTDSQRVDIHGKNIMNFIITYTIWLVVGVVTIPIIVGIGILSVWGILVMVFIIIASIKSFNGEDWQYPLTIKFIK
jgi:hypothetical protein